MYLKIRGKRYKYEPNINTLKVLGALLLIIVLVASVRSCTRHNRAIRGEKYEEVLVSLPEYQVRPCIAPDGTPTCDYFEIYPPAEGDKVVYLTFDDGPSPNVTPQILDVLKQHNIKATFFVLGNQVEKNPKILQKIASDGHAIANHTYSHDMNNIYSTPEAFINEINATRDTIVNLIGEEKYTGIFRFPGGAFRNERAEYKEMLQQNNIPFVNWNCLSGDSETRNPVPADLYNNTVRTATKAGKDALVLLMHDSATKQATVDSLPHIIKYFQDEGYRFDVLKRK